MNNNQGHLAILLMAAGESSRLGQAKQLVQYKGQSLLQRQVELLLSLSSQHVLSTHVVIGYKKEKMIAELAEQQLLNKTHVIEVDHWQQGLSTSIATAITEINHCDAVLILMVDQWQLNRQHLMQLIGQWQQDLNSIHIASIIKKTVGESAQLMSPPVILPKRYFSALMTLTGDEGAKMVIKQNQQFVTTLDMPSAFVDLDTPEQLKQLTQLQQAP